jgi:methionine aminopeptidase
VSVPGTREAFLWNAQAQAEALFRAVVDRRLIRPGVLESDLSREIHRLARDEFGVRRHWHRRIVRSGVNTLLGFRAAGDDRRLSGDDVVFLDFGPVFGDWEADFGRTYVLGSDPRKLELVDDLAAIFRGGQSLYASSPELTAGALYDYVSQAAAVRGWEFGADTAGHLIDHFPHGRDPDRREVICHGNGQRLDQPLADGRARHWILEVHLIDRARGFGGFYEELLTVRAPQ